MVYRFLYTIRMKPIAFRGSSLDDLKAFPQDARRETGYPLDKVQNGFPPDDAKPMPSIGSGVLEIRIWDLTGTYRVVYVARFAKAVFVLHCFKKKTMRTSKKDLDLATKRHKELLREIS